VLLKDATTIEYVTREASEKLNEDYELKFGGGLMGR
jgi:hypothetical protein